MIADIRERQPHIVVTLPDEVHILAIADLRRLVNGEQYHGEKDQLIQVLAMVALDVID